MARAGTSPQAATPSLLPLLGQLLESLERPSSAKAEDAAPAGSRLSPNGGPGKPAGSISPTRPIAEVEQFAQPWRHTSVFVGDQSPRSYLRINAVHRRMASTSWWCGKSRAPSRFVG